MDYGLTTAQIMCPLNIIQILCKGQYYGTNDKTYYEKNYKQAQGISSSVSYF